MKDPQASVDLGSVSAYSVYKGLVPNVTSYQDTSEGNNASRRKKARRRNKKRQRQGENGIEAKEESGSKEVDLSTRNGGDNKTPTKNQMKFQSQAGETKTKKVENLTSVSNGKDIKEKKRNKRKNSMSMSNNMFDKSTVEEDLDAREKSSTPAKKSKSFTHGSIVPNPLARNSLNQTQFKSVNNSAVEENNVKSASKQKLKSAKSADPSGEAVNGTVKKNKKSETFSTPAVEKEKFHRPTMVLGHGIKKHWSSINNQKGYSEPTDTEREVKDGPYKVESKTPPPDLKEIFDPRTRVEDSVEHGKSILDWMIHPVTSDEFMKQYWENKPLLIKRTHDDAQDFYKCILTTQKLDGILRRNVLKYGINLDITNYTNGVRETLSENMQGRVRPAVVWDYYNNGCSLRILNPQTYIQRLWKINAGLQEWFGSFVGANMYLTPKDSQGFAPHYDDIEAFILQIEGKKQWKVYAPRNENEKLPRVSSANFSEETDGIGEPILDVILEEGDLLYFPRGFIHQAKTVDGEHSLHITVSCHQLNSYGDLLKHHVNYTLEKLLATDVNFRQGLPTDYLSYMGIAHENSKDKDIMTKREAFSKKVSSLVTKIATQSADFAADAMGKKFIWDSLPPYLASKERETTVLEDGEFMTEGRVFNRVEFGPEVKVKLVRKHCVRLVVEDGHLKLYYSTENPLVYHEEEAQHLELAVEQAPIINHLICQYPNYTKIEELPISSDDIGEKIQVISDLWERGLILTKKQLEACDIDEDFDSDEEDKESQSDEDANPSEILGLLTGKNNNKDDDVESINLSDLDEESEVLSEDEFYDTTLFDSDEENNVGSENSDDDDDEDDESIDDDDSDGGDELDGVDFGFGDSEDDDNDDEFDNDEDDDEDEEEVDEDEFDKMDMMSSDSDED